MQTLVTFVSPVRERAGSLVHQSVALLRWWMAELRDVVTLLRKRFGGRRNAYVLTFGPDGVLLHPIDQPASSKTISGEFGTVPPVVDAIGPQKGRPDLVVQLCGSEVLTSAFKLPPMDQRALEAAMHLQIERRRPLSAQSLYIGWRATHAAQGEQRQVELAMCRRSHIDALKQSAGRGGWRLRAVVPVRSEILPAGTEINLLPSSIARLEVEIGSVERKMIVAACALLATWMLTIWGQWAYERWRLKEPLHQAHAKLQHIEQDVNRLETISAPIRALRTMIEHPDAAVALSAFSEALPEDAWIYDAEFQSTDAGVQFKAEGFANSAPALVNELENSHQFTSVQLVQATAANVGSDTQRFELRAQLARASVK